METEVKYPYPTFENTLVIPKGAAHTATDALEKAHSVDYVYAHWNNCIWFEDANKKPCPIYVQKRLTLEDLHMDADRVDWVWNPKLMEPAYE